MNWKKRLSDGRMKNIAFVLDPDGYWIEVADPLLILPSWKFLLTARLQVIQNEKMKRSSNW